MDGKWKCTFTYSGIRYKWYEQNYKGTEVSFAHSLMKRTHMKTTLQAEGLLFFSFTPQICCYDISMWSWVQFSWRQLHEIPANLNAVSQRREQTAGDQYAGLHFISLYGKWARASVSQNSVIRGTRRLAAIEWTSYCCSVTLHFWHNVIQKETNAHLILNMHNT